MQYAGFPADAESSLFSPLSQPNIKADHAVLIAHRANGNIASDVVFTLDDLLQRMGWKREAPVIQFGRGANPNDFRAKPADGVPKLSGGNVAEIFRQRRPPVKKAPAPGGSGGAY